MSYEIEHAHREKYAGDQWVGWLKSIRTNEYTFTHLGQALVFAEREYQQLQNLVAEVLFQLRRHLLRQGHARVERQKRGTRYVAAQQGSEVHELPLGA